MAGDGMRSAWIFMLLLLLLPSRFPALGEFALPEDGILTITSNMADRSYFEGKMMYLFYSRDFYILEFPYVKRNDAENTNFKSFVFRKSYVERFVKALNLHRFEEHAGSLDDSGGFIRINYTGGRSAELYISNKTYLIFEEKKERKAYVSSLDASTVQNLISSLLYDGERQSLDFIKLTYGDSERRAYTKFNNNLKTVRLWTASFSGEDVISVIWEPCGCRHDSSDPDYTRFNKAYLYFYVHDGQIVGKEILKENQTVKESERDMTLLEKDYLAHNRIETPAPVTLPPTVPPTESPSPTEPPTQTPLPTSAPTEPPTFTPMPSPTVSEDALLSFSIGLIFGSISFAIAFFAGNHRRNRKPFK